MAFKLLYLVADDQTFTENCDIIYPDGSISKCNSPIDHPSGGSKKAEAWIVDTLYNNIRKVAKPHPGVLRWLKQGDIIPPGTFFPEVIPSSGKETLFYVRCPKCGKH